MRRKRKMAEMINVIYEDNHLLVVEKPPNIPVQADSSHDEDLLTLLKGYIKEKYNKPGDVYLGLVHRLDRPVGGVMVFARTSKAAERLSRQFASKAAKKRYAAVVEGRAMPEAALTDFLSRDEKTNTAFVCREDDPGAKNAKLFYRRCAYRDGASLVDIELMTGRHHQIRVQLASRGLPIWGDQRYNRSARTGQQIALWAYSLEIEHPTQKIPMRFISLPKGGVWDGFQNELYALLADTRLVYIDESMLVVNKQSGESVARDDGDENNLEARLSEVFGDVYPIHRFDATTKGLVLFARSAAAAEELSLAMKERRIHKFYRCTVKGVPSPRSAVIRAYCVKDAREGFVSVFDAPRPNSKEMVTGYRVISEQGDMSELEIELFTGRTHQIRAHLAHIGHPLLGDDKYGDRQFNKLHKARDIALTAVRLEVNGKVFSIEE